MEKDKERPRIFGEKGLDFSDIDWNESDDIAFETFDFEVEDPIAKADDLNTLVELVRALDVAYQFEGFNKWFIPGSIYGIERLPKHRAFFFAGETFKERYLSLSNRSGKTVAGAFEATLHATGLYPSWWKGKRFGKPTHGWACGETAQGTRDIIQKELLGDLGSFGSGMIPKELIVDTSARSGMPGAVDTIQVRHVSGGISTIGLKSYEQKIKAFYGTAKDWIWLDELPPADIYSECYIRTMTTKGIIFVTATPLEGLTPLVLNFYIDGTFLPEGHDVPGIVKLAREDYEREAAKKLARGEKLSDIGRKSKAVIVGGWDDAPWLEEEEKARMLAATPPHLRAARSTGLPTMGSGTVFPIPLEEIIVNDFPIPAHYKRIYGMDVGWNCTAAAHLAQDPDTGIVYLYSEHKRGQAEPVVHATAIQAKGDWIPGMIDPASRGRNQNDGKQLYNLYRKLNLRLIIADNAVEAGIYTMWEMFSTGRLKIFRSCTEFQKEYVTYRRDDKGRIIKENDHLCDAVRYAVAGLQHARQKPISRMNQQQGATSGKRYF